MVDETHLELYIKMLNTFENKCTHAHQEKPYIPNHITPSLNACYEITIIIFQTVCLSPNKKKNGLNGCLFNKCYLNGISMCTY